MYLPRKIDQELVLWRNEKEGKPLLIRGARQVGKSTAIRELAKQFDFYLEVNFEEQRRVHRLFEGDLNPKELCENLSILYNIPIIPGKHCCSLMKYRLVSQLSLLYGSFTKNTRSFM